MRRSSSGLTIALLAAAALVVAGCGEDSTTIPDSSGCPEQPLYHWAFVTLRDGGPSTWIREDPSGKPLTAAALKAISDAVKNGCLSGAGSAESLDAGK